MSYHHQWLYLRDESDSYEVFNGARTAAYLANPDSPLGCAKVSNVLDFGGCPAYAFDPPCDPDEAYFEFHGTADNHVDAPDAANLDIVGDITLIADIALDDWTPAAKAGVIGKWTSLGQFSYRLSVTTAGALEFQWTTNGSTILTATSTANLGSLPAGTRKVIRVDFDVNNGASGRTARFWTADDRDGAYTQLGTAVTSATATSIDDGTSVVMFGQAGTDVMDGKLYWGQVRTGISTDAVVGGTAVLTFDASPISAAGQLVFAATTGQTMTIVRAGVTPTEVFIGEPWWEPRIFVDPEVDDAPWFSADIDESADLLGFFVEEWTGLDNGHSKRQVTRTGRPGGGGQLGVLGSAERVMKLNVLVLGASERALEYGMRWLSSRLGNVCATCAASSMLIRRFCPATSEDLWNGVAELREVGLIEDVTWENEPVERAGCFIRRLSFTLAAGDPCMYLPSSDAPAAAIGDAALCYDALPIGAGKSTCRPMCVDLPEDCRSIFSFDVPEAVGVVAPVLTLTNESDHPVPPLRLIAYADPHDDGVAPNPCGLPILGEIYTQVIPPWTEIIWDVAARKVLYSDHTTVGLEGGFRLMDAVDPPFQRFFALPCGPAHIVVEPANTCLTVDAPNSRYTYSGYSFLWSELHFPAMSLQLQERVGCT